MRALLSQSVFDVLERPAASESASFAAPAADEHDAYYGRYSKRRQRRSRT
jgi:hypothetical protein